MKKNIKQKLLFVTSFILMGAVLSPIAFNENTILNVNAQINDNKLSDGQVDEIVQDLLIRYPEYSAEFFYDAVYNTMNGQNIVFNNGMSIQGWQGITTNQLAVAIDTAISVAIGGGIGSLASYMATHGTRVVRNSIATTLAKWGAGTIGATFIDYALGLASPGSYIANKIDEIDTVPYNGRINLW